MVFLAINPASIGENLQYEKIIADNIFKAKQQIKNKKELWYIIPANILYKYLV